MAELVTSMLIGPLVSMVKEKASKCLTKRYEAMAGMDEQLAVLERKLPAILDIIADAEEKGAHHTGVGAWLRALKAVAYEANDVFDEFKYEELRREAKKKGHYSKLGMDVVSLFLAHNPIVFRYRMGNKLRKIVLSIEGLVKDMNEFGFRQQPQEPPSNQCRQTDSIIIDLEKDIVERSRDEEKKEIVQMLLDQANNRDLMVLPIVGMGGLGKTTFAQLVYNDTEIQKHFQLQRWICVSDDFDVVNLANKICNKDEKDRENALKNLQQEVSGKRYLIVLDDVWDRDPDKWGKLKTCLQHGGTGSAILTTTRKTEVARIMGTVKEHNLNSLEKRFLKEIFERRAFGSQEQRPPKMVDIVDKIVEKCGGSPLAAKALGSVLSTKDSVEEWNAVLSRSIICNEETGILPILKISYDDLPLHMKQCFAFYAVFPKDYEIDVEQLIQLWMANEFIPPQKGIKLETTGKQIFRDLAWRSFFQDIEEDSFSSRTTCKIHDLMHDVALSIMEEECVTITWKRMGKERHHTELLPNTARHLFLSYDGMEKLLNNSLEKQSPSIQTLLCGWSGIFQESGISLKHSSKYSSLRALHLRHIQGGFPIRPKHLQHLRYLDLSKYCGITALPEEISRLYNLETLNLSGCWLLRQLPSNMKYMIGLRHIYTDGCDSLEHMPPGLGQLTSLQTLTYFVVGACSACSSIGELKHFKLGGRLKIGHLENVSEADARVANFGNMEELVELSLEWKDDSNEVLDHHENLMDSLKANNGLKVLRVDSYKNTTFPSWVSALQQLMELSLINCTMCEKLPQQWQVLPVLQVVHLEGLQRLQCLFIADRDSKACSTFPKLKELSLANLDSFQGWWEINGRQGEQLIFPQLEKLSIVDCKRLATLPEAPTLEQSAFPALKELKLCDLESFERWGASEGRQGELLTFPQLESVHIDNCQVLTTLPEAPKLENVCIMNCPNLTTIPEAPKLKVLRIDEEKPQMSLSIATYLTSLSELVLSVRDREATPLVEEKWNYESTVIYMVLSIRFHSSLPWKYFVHLEILKIDRCDELIYWPEKEFQCLVSLRRLTIEKCNKLIGNAPLPEQSTSERSQLLPRLEILKIWSCESLREVFKLPTSLKEIEISECPKIESLWWEQNTRLESLHIFRCDSLSEVLNLPPSLERISIYDCCKLQRLSGQLDALKHLEINNCSMLESLESCLGDLSSLISLSLWDCGNLTSLSNGPKSYSSLQYLTVRYCPGIKSLPKNLQLQLDNIENKYLSPRYRGPKLRDPKSWKYAFPGCIDDSDE